MVNSDSIELQTEAFKILLPLIMDKWEISTVLTPRLFSPFLKVAYQNRDKRDLMNSAQALFDEIESVYIWSDILHLVIDGDNNNSDENCLDVLEFILKDFNVNEEEMLTVHLPFTVLCLLSSATLDTTKLKALQLLISLVPGRLFEALEPVDDFSNDGVVNKIKSWYSSRIHDEETDIPFSKSKQPI